MLEELRQKPPYVKKAYAFWSAIGATAVVGMLWSVSLPTRISQITQSVGGSHETTQMAGSAFSRFFESLQGTPDTAGGQAGEAAAPAPAEETNVAPAASPSTSTSAQPAIIIATTSRPATVPQEPSIQIATSSAASE